MLLIQADPAPPSAAMIVGIIAAFAVVFPLFWCFVISILSLVGGWSRLARAYPGTGREVVDRSFGMASGSLGVVNYNGVLNVGVGGWGVGLSVFFLFRCMHPPIAIPWAAVESCAARTVLFWRVLEMRLGSGERIRLRGPAGAAVEEAWQRQGTAAAQPVG